MVMFQTPTEVDGRELTYCDCARCEIVMLGDSWKDWWSKLASWAKKLHPEPVFIRFKGRPYCRLCWLKGKERNRHESLPS
jgi:hypothetical protein